MSFFDEIENNFVKPVENTTFTKIREREQRRGRGRREKVKENDLKTENEDV